jgi:hypothetical protein
MLLGCTSGLKISMPDKYTDTQNQPIGFLVGTLGATTVWPSTGETLITTLHIREVSTRSPILMSDDDIENEVITLTNENQHFDFKNENEMGQLFTLPLPVGEYEIFQVTIKGSNGNQTFTQQTDKNLSLKFEITAANASYIGEFIAKSRVAKSQLWNIEFPSGYGYFLHGYNKARDEILFYELNPQLTDIQFDVKTLTTIKNRLIYTKMNKS